MTAYYNENDPFAAAWLRALMADGLIASGVVDERSILDVRPAELAGFTQCHFFAGVGGWSYALRLAGWSDDRPVWSGSCPCQPFSAAGARRGTHDERHLWPHWRWIIDQRRPATILGEQVASKDGRKWFAGVRSDLERMAYRVGAADLCAASAGAPHIRQRLYWMADSRCHNKELGRSTCAGTPQCDESKIWQWKRIRFEFAASGPTGGTADSSSGRLGIDGSASGRSGHVDQCEPVSRVGNTTNINGRSGEYIQEKGIESCQLRRWGSSESSRECPWTRYDLIPCADGKTRRVEPGTFPLAHGIPARVGRLRGYGNAINPWQAKPFIEACLDVLPESVD